MKYDASVIIPTYNRAIELRLTLDALVKQKTCYKFEVIIADDGSSDDTKMVVGEYANKLDLKYCFQEDKGYRCTLARNMGIRNASGEICIFIDCGVLLIEYALQMHIDCHKRNKNMNCLVLGYTYGNYPLTDFETGLIRDLVAQADIETTIRTIDQNGMEDSRERMYRMYGDELYEWPAPWAVVYGCNLSISRKFVHEIGMFDENFTSWGADDNEFGLRAFLNGAKVILERGAASVYYPHATANKMKSDPKEFKRKLLINQEYIYKKFPIEEVKLWMEIEPFYELNKILMERLNKA